MFQSIKSLNFKRLFLWFLFFSVVGWCYEVFLEVVVYRWGFSNRGVLWGPYCIVYGLGALIIIFSLALFVRRWKGNQLWLPLMVFFGGGMIATVVELTASYLMEIIIGGWLWDYSGYWLNFQGRIAFNPSFRFALGSLLFIYVLLPVIEKILNRIGEEHMTRLFQFAFGVFAVDVAVYIMGRF